MNAERFLIFPHFGKSKRTVSYNTFKQYGYFFNWKMQWDQIWEDIEYHQKPCITSLILNSTYFIKFNVLQKK